MIKIFISYRQADSQKIAGRIYDHLKTEFGGENVFKDSYSIAPGDDIRGKIHEAISKCDIVIVIIGKKWLGIKSKNGTRRLDDPADLVRVEVEIGLQRNAARVIPILVDKAEMPSPGSLPLSLREMSFKKGLEVGEDPHFLQDIKSLIESLKTLEPAKNSLITTSSNTRIPIKERQSSILLFAVLLIITILFLLFRPKLGTSTVLPTQPYPVKLVYQFLVDTSQEMAKSLGDGEFSRYEAAIEAISKIVKTPGTVTNQTWLSLRTAGGGINNNCDLSQLINKGSRDDFLSREFVAPLLNIEPSGNTAYLRGLDEALNDMSQEPAKSSQEKIIFVFWGSISPSLNCPDDTIFDSSIRQTFDNYSEEQISITICPFTFFEKPEILQDFKDRFPEFFGDKSPCATNIDNISQIDELVKIAVEQINNGLISIPSTITPEITLAPTLTLTNTGISSSENIELTLIYSPESRLYMPQIIADFNAAACATGTDPLTSESLSKPICIRDLTGGNGASSGTIMQEIVDAIAQPNNPDLSRPTIFQPSVSHWLSLANYRSGQQIFDFNQTQPTTLTPVVIAIWESRLQAIRNKIGRNDVSWNDLLAVLSSPNGWADYGINDGRRTVFYGHTDPLVSSTALSTLMAEFTASAKQFGFNGRQLSLGEVNNLEIQQGVRDIENLVRHYAPRTTELVYYIAQGPEYVDFIALEENDVIAINRGSLSNPQPSCLTSQETTTLVPPEKLVALYPQEGTFIHEHPIGIVNAPWTSPEQQNAAKLFAEYVVSPVPQELIMNQGFRPYNSSVSLGGLFTPQYGVDPSQPTNILESPRPEVIDAIQKSWSLVRKPADIMLLVDISGSMIAQGKLRQAQQAALAFLDNMNPDNRVGLTVFGNEIITLVPLGNFRDTEAQLREAIETLQASNDTELYTALVQAIEEMDQQPDTGRIRAVVLLSDGRNEGVGDKTIEDVQQAIVESSESLNPVIVVPVAYGTEADIPKLRDIAITSNTQLYCSIDPQEVDEILDNISKYF
jgi:Ca-activated chloride channel homolog